MTTTGTVLAPGSGRPPPVSLTPRSLVYRTSSRTSLTQRPPRSIGGVCGGTLVAVASRVLTRLGVWDLDARGVEGGVSRTLASAGRSVSATLDGILNSPRSVAETTPVASLDTRARGLHPRRRRRHSRAASSTADVPTGSYPRDGGFSSRRRSARPSRSMRLLFRGY